MGGARLKQARKFRNSLERYRIGVDVGGTHTDVALTDAQGRAYRIEKVPSTPHNPAIAVLAGLDRLLASGVAPHEIAFFSHGTTATTNALLEMKGAKTALIINAGMSGILEVQSQGRDGWSPFDHFFTRPQKLVRPRHVREIAGRMDYRGREIEPLDEAGGARGGAFASRRRRAVGRRLLSVLVHERRARAAGGADRARGGAGRVRVAVERGPAAPARMAAFLHHHAQRLARAGACDYCAQIGEGLDARGILTRQRFLMQSNGGVMPLGADAEVHAVRTLLSGPAAGVRGASHLLGAIQGWRNLVTMDIGGTSCDIAFIESGEPLEQADSVIDGRVVGVPALDVTTVAAGGGSIARLDAAGMPQVGPRSAGASPGPACYGRGGVEPTTTDASLVCGALNADYFLGGETKLDLEAARRALAARIAEPMGVDVVDAAAGVLRIVNAHISDAIRIEAAKKGLDLAGHTLVPFGGAGPVHAALVAEDLGISRVLVPRNPGAFSALGLLCSDVRHDYLRSQMASLASLDPAQAQELFRRAGASGRARRSPTRGSMRARPCSCARWTCAMRGKAMNCASPLDGRVRNARRAGADARSQIASMRSTPPCTAIARRTPTSRSSAIGCAPSCPCRNTRPSRTPSTQAQAPRRGACAASRWVRAAHSTRRVFRRDDIAPGWRAQGPAIIEQKDSTTLAPDGWSVRCDEWSNLVLERTGMSPRQSRSIQSPCRSCAIASAA